MIDILECISSYVYKTTISESCVLWSYQQKRNQKTSHFRNSFFPQCGCELTRTEANK